jgi:hyperosmotically inducible periplasmic protein
MKGAFVMRSFQIAGHTVSAALGAIAIAFALSGTAVAQTAERSAQEPERTNSLRDPAKSNTESGYAEDRVITERVQAALDAQPDLRTAMLRVQTSNRQVLLSGGVETTSQRDLAIQVARSVEGVSGVQDAITLKQPQA